VLFDDSPAGGSKGARRFRDRGPFLHRPYRAGSEHWARRSVPASSAEPSLPELEFFDHRLFTDGAVPWGAPEGDGYACLSLPAGLLPAPVLCFRHGAQHGAESARPLPGAAGSLFPHRYGTARSILPAQIPAGELPFSPAGPRAVPSFRSCSAGRSRRAMEISSHSGPANRAIRRSQWGPCGDAPVRMGRDPFHRASELPSAFRLCIFTDLYFIQRLYRPA